MKVKTQSLEARGEKGLAESRKYAAYLDVDSRSIEADYDGGDRGVGMRKGIGSGNGAADQT